VNSVEVSDAAMLAGISAAFIVLKDIRKKPRKIPAIDMDISDLYASQGES